MSSLTELDVTKKFLERIARETLADDIKIIYRVAGGMPSERVEEEFRLSGSGKASISRHDTLRAMPARAISVEIDRTETRELFQQISSELEGLLPRSKALFLPDSLVGSITIEVDKEEVTFFFPLDEEEQVVPEANLTPQMTKVLQRLKTKSRQLLERAEEISHE